VLREVGVEVLLELRQSRLAGKGLVGAEEREDDVGLLPPQVRRRIAEVQGPGLERDGVAAPAEIPDDELQVGESGVQQRLEMVEKLHPLGQRVADEHDVIALAQLDRRRRSRRLGARAGARERDERNRRNSLANRDHWLFPLEPADSTSAAPSAHARCYESDQGVAFGVSEPLYRFRSGSLPAAHAQ
jgi:hypothetical protein